MINVLITSSLESVYWLSRGAPNILSQEMLRAPEVFGSFMIIMFTFYFKMQSLVGICLHRMQSWHHDVTLQRHEAVFELCSWRHFSVLSTYVHYIHSFSLMFPWSGINIISHSGYLPVQQWTLPILLSPGGCSRSVSCLDVWRLPHIKGQADSLRGDTCQGRFASSFDQTTGQYFVDCDQNKSQPSAVYNLSGSFSVVLY